MAGGRDPKKKQATFWDNKSKLNKVEQVAEKRGLDRSKYIVESLGINLLIDELQIAELASEQNLSKEAFIINILKKELEHNKRKENGKK